MRARWEFRRYDRLRGILRSRGWLHYAGLRPLLLVVGFSRGWRYRKGRGPGWSRRYPAAWIELTLYPGTQMFDVYPGVRVPEPWL